MTQKLFISLIFATSAMFGQLTNSENYVHQIRYTTPVTDPAVDINAQKIHQVTYFDGAGRPIQNILATAGGNEETIYSHFEYDSAGRQSLQYLPYSAAVSSPLQYNDGIKDLIPGYYSGKFSQDFIAGIDVNAYSQVIYENAPNGRILKQGAPGSDWKIGQGNDHSIKFEYRGNLINEVYLFDVDFQGEGTEVPILKVLGKYAPNQLFVTSTKNENWEEGDEKLNTTEIFRDKIGRAVLSRAFTRGNEAHDTYYVYDMYGNLSFVLPPKASQEVIQNYQLQNNTISLPWTNLAVVDEGLASEYGRVFSEYGNQLLADQDLFLRYGGQGGLVVSKNQSGQLKVEINITTVDSLKLKNGVILELGEIGTFRDSEIGAVQGINYKYIFQIKDNHLFVSGDGKLNVLNTTFNGEVKLEYNKNYPWPYLLEIDPRDKDALLMEYKRFPNEEILTAQIPNIYGGFGGFNIQVDEFDNISVALNFTVADSVKLRNGIVLPLEVQRRLADRELGYIENAAYKYRVTIRDNKLVFEGEDIFYGSVNKTVGTPPVVATNSMVVPQPVIEGLCYEYRYDTSFNRLVEKRVPGKGWEYLVYDRLDRVLYVQDALARLEKRWHFAKYDRLGRAAYSGEFIFESAYANVDSQLRKEMQNVADANENLHETRLNSFQHGGISIEYTTAIFPAPTQNGYNVFSINYYDNYNFEPLGQPIAAAPSLYSTVFTNNLKSMPTGSLVRVVGTDDWEFNTIHYDEKGQTVRTESKNSYLNSVDKADIQYSFIGQVTESIATHQKGQSIIKVTNSYQYDHAGRLLHLKHKINDVEPAELISFSKYDDLGRLIEKKIGGAPAISYAAANGLQTVNYGYNVRGWLTSINDPSSTSSNDLFSYGMNYNKLASGAPGLYNGNISEVLWKTASDNKLRRYNYSYDGLNRLESATYTGHEFGNSQQEQFHESASYNKNGNIVHLQRYGLLSSGVMDIIDELHYSYEELSNKLQEVTDYISTPKGFIDDTSADNDRDYHYDINGNLTADLNKDITNIKYNHLNQPVQIIFENQDPAYSQTPKMIEFVYNAAGKKIEKRITRQEFVSSQMQTVVNTQHYVAGAVYENDVLQFFSHPEGYVAVSNGQYQYVYQFKDQVGNVRLSFTQNGSGLAIIEENHYTPFGVRHEGYNPVTTTLGNSVAGKFRYNGQEFEQAHNINITEMDFRQYDATIGRFYNIDLMAESSYSMTPYHFSANNPVMYSDPTGLLQRYIKTSDIDPIQGGGGGNYGGYMGMLMGGNFYQDSKDSWWGNAYGFGLNGIEGRMGGGGESSTGFGGGSSEGLLAALFNLSGNGSTIWTNDGGGSFSSKLGTFDYIANNFIANELFQVNLPELIVKRNSITWSSDIMSHVYAHSPYHNLKVTFEQAKLWYQNAGGAAMHVNLNSIDLSAVSMSDFKDGLVTVHLAGIHFSNVNDALVHGTITLQRVGSNQARVALNAERHNKLVHKKPAGMYDFEMHASNSKNIMKNILTTHVRNPVTFFGGIVNGVAPIGGMFTYVGGTPFPIYYYGTVTIKP